MTPDIIEKTICIVLRTSTAMYRLFLQHCTLTNKAVGIAWRAFSKPPHTRHGAELCPTDYYLGLLQPFDFRWRTDCMGHDLFLRISISLDISTFSFLPPTCVYWILMTSQLGTRSLWTILYQLLYVFHKHCTLTNKATGIVWRALSKPPQRRQSPDICNPYMFVLGL